jgi:Domain of unknown function (DUF1844)
MASKDREEQSGFVVNDRRLFSSDGELREDVVKAEEVAAEQERAATAAQQRTNDEREAQQKAAQTSEAPAESPSDLEVPEGPSDAEHQASADAYAASTKQVDERIHKELSKQGRAGQARDLEMSFDKFVASLYMTTLMQLGLAAPQGEKPMLDLMGARQTIDILAILKDKTKGNLTPTEDGTLLNVLYELRMAYLEVTNMLANPPKDGIPTAN